MTEAPAQSCLLVIENGPQAGASVRLSRGTYGVGRAIVADIVIGDDSLEDRHFEVVVGDAVYLSPLSGGLSGGNGRPLNHGRRLRLNKAFGIQAGQTRFRLIPDASTSIMNWRPRSGITSASTLLLAFAFGSLFIFSPTAEPSSLVSLAKVPHRLSMVDHKRTSAIERRPDFPAAARAFAAELTRVGLSEVSIVAAGQGAIAADGSIGSSQNASWDEARRWFDKTLGSDFVLINRLSPPRHSAPLSVVAVWSGPEPYVIDQQGKKLFLGNVLPTGWSIAAIHPDRLLLRRAGQLLVVRF